MGLLIAAILGAVQGITEFLPVSSSAHLLLGRELFGWGEGPFGLIFDVATHLGTLAATLIYFRADILTMVRALPGVFGSSQPARLIRLIVIGTIPAVLVGLLFGHYIEAHLRRPIVTVVTLTLGAIGFFIVERLGARTRGEESLTMRDAIVFGLGQAAALVPGMSRSGTTITVGMLSGIRREAAARFTFLLGIPAVVAAAVKEGYELRHLGGLSPEMTQAFVVGILVSGVVGYLSVRFLIRYLATHRLDVFAWYRLALAAAVWLWVGN
jgi:undecaprenyl-diphosphatase